MPEQVPILVESLSKTFRIGFERKVVDAVHNVSFAVPAGEIFGFLGPNGAGKTTTIKMCMDLIRPTSGAIRIFGRTPSDIDARARIGYLPEQPYFYDYLTPTELLDFFGRLYGMPSAELAKRIDEVLDLVGLSHARTRTLRKFSKGMLQRAALAQALLSHPDLVVLDEPMSGLDPIGRKEFKDIILSLRSRGCTVFFSSHILADVELLCDKIAIIDHGKLRFSGATRDFLSQGQAEVEVIASNVPEQALVAITPHVRSSERIGTTLKLLLDKQRVADVLAKLMESKAEIVSVVPRSETLEEIFFRTATGRPGANAAAKLPGGVPGGGAA